MLPKSSCTVLSSSAMELLLPSSPFWLNATLWPWFLREAGEVRPRAYQHRHGVLSADQVPLQAHLRGRGGGLCAAGGEAHHSPDSQAGHRDGEAQLLARGEQKVTVQSTERLCYRKRGSKFVFFPSCQCSGQMFKKLESILSSRFSQFQPRSLIEVLHACIHLERFPLNHLSRVFSPYFLQRLQGEAAHCLFVLVDFCCCFFTMMKSPQSL